MKLLKLLTPLLIVGLQSCGKTEESMIDCLGQSFLTNIEHTASEQNPKIVNFTISYSGEQELSNSVQWDYGDGKKQTLTGKTASHTYSQSGTFSAIATVTTSHGCTFDVKESVSVN